MANETSDHYQDIHDKHNKKIKETIIPYRKTSKDDDDNNEIKNENNDAEVKQKKKAVITLSIDGNVLDEIKQESDNEQTNLSASVNKILSKHILTYRFCQDMKSVFISQKTFEAIIEQIDEDLLTDDFTNNALDFVPAIFYSKNIPFTLDNLIKYAIGGAALDGGIYNHFHHYIDQEGYINLVMRHNLGLKWSRVLSRGQSKLIETVLKCHTLSTILPSTVIIKVLDKGVKAN